MGEIKVIHSDCLDAMKAMDADSIDAIVTDPPAGIAFMGKEWDKDKGGRDAWVKWMTEVARECLRVIKPGGHALVWAIPRTSHWTGWAWEDAGWEPRDKIVHLFGSGFPKSLSVSKAIDKAAGAEREVVGTRSIAYPDSNCWGIPNRNSDGAVRSVAHGDVAGNARGGVRPVTAPATDAAKQWDGWGTALKPAAEDWWLFRKPLVGTVAANVLAHGTGAINVDGCRIGTANDVPSVKAIRKTDYPQSYMGDGPGWGRTRGGRAGDTVDWQPYAGRWPANVTLDEEAARLLDEQSGLRGAVAPASGPLHEGPSDRGAMSGSFGGMKGRPPAFYGDSGGASRFFYTAKASRSERGEGNTHPTVKPIALMRWLVRLITPPGGLVLDPFAGSGTTLLAVEAEGFNGIGIEREAEYVEIIRCRLKDKVLDWSDEVEDQTPQEDSQPVPLSLDDLFGFDE